jgi:MFS family permease
MTMPDAPPSPVPHSRVSVAARPRLPLKALIAVGIGNWLEFYDFLVFTFFAVMIGDAFFPGDSQMGRLLGALATFGVGFVTRPLGAAIIGAYADRAGRRAALTLTFMLMAVGSGLVGLTPSYEQIGMTAPIVLVLARLIQGFSCGGEVGPATTYLLESAPIEHRAAITAWQGHTQQLAVFVGSFAGVVLTTSLTTEQLYAWGWRVPFIVGMLIAPVGLYIRRQLPETIDPRETHQSTGAVLNDLLRHHWRAVLVGVLVICGGTVTTYVLTYMTTYAITTLHLSPRIGTSLAMTGSIAAMAGLALGAWADRFGRKRMLVASRIVFALIVYPAYVAMTSPGAGPAAIIAINMLLNFAFSLGIGAIYAFLPEAFPMAVRSSGLSILYALGVTIFGGTTQFVVAWLIDLTGDPLVPAWYQLAATLIGIAGVVLLKTHPEVLRERSALAAAS